ncbi:MAG: hypothetical protein II978_07480 [Clostridia bacterium]|nr:hypothetical protein [Clostridia bacterium]
MENFKSCLQGIDVNEKCAKFLKGELSKKFDKELLYDFLSLPVIKHMHKERITILINLIRDGVYDYDIISSLCDELEDVSNYLWLDIVNMIDEIIHEIFYKFDRRAQLKLAYTLEVLYAKGFSNIGIMLQKLFEIINFSNLEFSPDSEENVHIRLAKVAYSCNAYNYPQKVKCLKSIKEHLKMSKNKHLMGMLNYYKGISYKCAHLSYDGKNDEYYILKSRNRGFELAKIYFEYINIHIEKSKKSLKA